MTADPPPPRPEGPDPGLDVDAAFADIVAHFGPQADLGPEPAQDLEPDPDGLPPGRAEPAPPSEPTREAPHVNREPRWREPLENEATWEDEGHFVPPPPPP